MRRIVAVVLALAAVVLIPILVSDGSNGSLVTVPDVVGMTYAEGVSAVREAGFRVDSVDPVRCRAFRGMLPEAVVVARIRRDGTFIQGGVDAVPSGTKIALDAGVANTGTTACLVPTPRRFEWRPIVGLLWVTGVLVASVLAGRDMRRRGENGGVWGIIVFLLFPLGVLLWLVVRAGKPIIPGADVQMRRDAEAFSPFEPSDRG